MGLAAQKRRHQFWQIDFKGHPDVGIAQAKVCHGSRRSRRIRTHDHRGKSANGRVSALTIKQRLIAAWTMRLPHSTFERACETNWLVRCPVGEQQMLAMARAL